MLMRRDAGANRIAFVDVAAPNYSPEANAGISFEAAMERIHAVLPDGTIVTGEALCLRMCGGALGNLGARGGWGGGGGRSFNAVMLRISCGAARWHSRTGEGASMSRRVCRWEISS